MTNRLLQNGDLPYRGLDAPSGDVHPRNPSGR